MTNDRDQLPRSEAVTVAAIEDSVALLVEARDIVAAFQATVGKRFLEVLEPWLERARLSLLMPIANAVLKDNAAVTKQIRVVSQWELTVNLIQCSITTAQNPF